jgi:hypothetical protein
MIGYGAEFIGYIQANTRSFYYPTNYWKLYTIMAIILS